MNYEDLNDNTIIINIVINLSIRVTFAYLWVI